MEKFTFLGKKVAMSAFLCCFSLVGFAQEDTQTFNFDATETQEYAAVSYTHLTLPTKA